MATKLSKWGNSLGVRLPTYIVEHACLTAGDYLSIKLLDSGEIVIQPVKARDVRPSQSSHCDSGSKQQLRPETPPEVW